MPAIPAVDRPHQGPDYAAVKQRQQATWASGDFSVVAARIVYQAEQLCETAELQAGKSVSTGGANRAGVLDVAIAADYVETVIPTEYR